MMVSFIKNCTKNETAQRPGLNDCRQARVDSDSTADFLIQHALYAAEWGVWIDMARQALCRARLHSPGVVRRSDARLSCAVVVSGSA
jgi:hypothetical protein